MASSLCCSDHHHRESATIKSIYSVPSFGTFSHFHPGGQTRHRRQPCCCCQDCKCCPRNASKCVWQSDRENRREEVMQQQSQRSGRSCWKLFLHCMRNWQFGAQRNGTDVILIHNECSIRSNGSSSNSLLMLCAWFQRIPSGTLFSPFRTMMTSPRRFAITLQGQTEAS